jgi:hypothetical protein
MMVSLMLALLVASFLRVGGLEILIARGFSGPAARCVTWTLVLPPVAASQGA